MADQVELWSDKFQVRLQKLFSSLHIAFTLSMYYYALTIFCLPTNSNFLCMHACNYAHECMLLLIASNILVIMHS